MLAVTSAMRLIRNLSLLLIVTACASNQLARESLAPYLPESQPDSFRFFHGSWFAPDSIYSFQLSDELLFVAKATDAGVETKSITFDECVQLADRYAELKSALLHTAAVASGAAKISRPEEIVMDGPDYRLEYWSRDASTTLMLDGGGNAQLVVPWVDAALAVRSIGEKCGDS